MAFFTLRPGTVTHRTHQLPGTVTHLTPQLTLFQLKWLNASNNDLQDINCLSQCAQLMALNLENNDLKTIAGVENLRGLRSLNVRNNDLRTCGAGLRQCTELTDIDLHSNDIDDFRRYIVHTRVGGVTRPPLERVVPRTVPRYTPLCFVCFVGSFRLAIY
jgi:hypothetical protein